MHQTDKEVPAQTIALHRVLHIHCPDTPRVCVCVCGRGESLSLPSGHEGSAQACLTNKDEQTHT